MKTLFTMLVVICAYTSVDAKKVSFRKAPKNMLIIAHRGASGYLPEHTLAAKSLAHFQGVDYIEQDVVLTKDNIPIVLHDIYLDTVTNVKTLFPKKKRKDGRYYAIDFTLKEIKQLAVHERTNHKTGKAVFPKRFPKNLLLFRIPTLKEEIKLIKGLNQSQNKEVGIYVEIKKPEFHSKEKKNISGVVLKALNSAGYFGPEQKVFIQCFHSQTLETLSKQTNIPLIQLIADDSWKESSNNYSSMLTRQGLEKIKTYAVGIGPWIPQVFRGLKKGRPLWTPVVALAREVGLKVHAYTFRKEELPVGIDKFEDLLAYFIKDAAVDGIFTDFPREAIKVRDRYKN